MQCAILTLKHAADATDADSKDDGVNTGKVQLGLNKVRHKKGRNNKMEGLKTF